MKDIFLFYFFSSLLPQLSNSYSSKPKDQKTLALYKKIIFGNANLDQTPSGATRKGVLQLVATFY